MPTTLTIEQRDARERGRVAALMQKPNAVFVFGSNEAGLHGGGAARVALLRYGAMMELGEGFAGRSYALPTMDRDIEPLSIDAIHSHVVKFIGFAASRRDLTFAVTRVGCGIAGFTDEDIAVMFNGAPDNCALPEGWDDLIAAARRDATGAGE